MKKKPILLVIAAVVLGGSAIYYCYGPTLPAVADRLSLRWEARAAYFRGWIDASAGRMRGDLVYSFHNYIVLGVAEYAREVDGIGAPTNPKLSVDYLAGFNQRMSGAIRHRVGEDFPEGYVHRFYDRGWLDFTTEQPMICPVHNERLDVAVIPFELVFPLTMARPKFDWEIASAASFPFPGSTKKVDASWSSRPKNARVRVCPSCSKAESEWWATHKAPNSKGSASAAAQSRKPVEKARE